MTKRDKEKTAEPERYAPTGKEQALLDVLLDPYHRMASVKRICEVAKISRETYYRMMRKQEFADYYALLCREMVRNKAGQLLNIGIREARKGGSPGFGYWKELSKMAGLVEDDKVKVDMDSDVEVSIRFVGPDEE